MRPIDADKLLKEVECKNNDGICRVYKCEECPSYSVSFIDINKMPTVDTEKHGHWECETVRTLDNMNEFDIYRCSVCGESTDAEDLPYCYRCGAKMDEVSG